MTCCRLKSGKLNLNYLKYYQAFLIQIRLKLRIYNIFWAFMWFWEYSKVRTVALKINWNILSIWPPLFSSLCRKFNLYLSNSSNFYILQNEVNHNLRSCCSIPRQSCMYNNAYVSLMQNIYSTTKNHLKWNIFNVETLRVYMLK